MEHGFDEMVDAFKTMIKGEGIENGGILQDAKVAMIKVSELRLSILDNLISSDS